MSVDHLSKEALSLKPGFLSFSKHLEGEIIGGGMSKLF